MASDGARKQFWKRGDSKVPGSIQHVFGAQHPPFDPLLHSNPLGPASRTPGTPGKTKRSSTFQEFESDTMTHGDAGDDDDELLAMAAQRLHTPWSWRLSKQVLHHHSQQQRQGPSPAEPAGDPRTSSTVSESHTACPAEELRKLSWSGIPQPVRPVTWKLLSGYLPANTERRAATLQRKRAEYFAFLERYYDSRNEEAHRDTYRQIHIDIPRMSPETLILQPKVTEIFERILFIWAIRHPASGYVQGINDLVTPFFVVFISEHIEDEDVDTADISHLPEEALRGVEADTYWCLGRLLDGIQDNYTFAQPGIQTKVQMLEELVSRIDEPLHHHLDQHEVRYLQFAFRWMNNLLMRELPLRCTVRLWDTYQSEPEGFSHFHLYVCAAFLLRWRREILGERDFQELLLFLQNLPTAQWGDADVSLLLADAYRLQFAFADAPNHYKR
ncbi:LOW QUALITY PROTEIN: TBC1 domain family member 22A [Suncus etruscus]|uniref:LOW QUALITY PROTEIN: TBC1 domain family member 22A n=1 Tax=Suncus etruscus TaxID=109475 RepID=UPI00210F5B54|nr:LOW QUALITY PROTEIN: TBC1 domain family member 22A [Suncus etruscus]